MHTLAGSAFDNRVTLTFNFFDRSFNACLCLATATNCMSGCLPILTLTARADRHTQTDRQTNTKSQTPLITLTTSAGYSQRR